MKLAVALLMTIAAAVAAARPARACGGGVVSTPIATTIGADAQRIFISVHDGVTDVVTQIGVPATTADYGVLIPVPGQPTLDSTPVMSGELEVLFSATAPRIGKRADDGFSCGCPFATGSGGDKAGGESPPDTQVSEPVAIGPVTAVTLTADTGDAINAWLADNGFVIPADEQSIVSAYAGPGRYFIAIRRNDTAPDGGATSVGVHFTLAGDQRGLPLRFARIGAGPTVGFTILVAADDIVGPSAPFAALNLYALSAVSLRTSGYAAAMSAAISRHDDHAFVIEGSWTDSDLSRFRIDSLRPFIASGATLTRLSTLLPVTALDADVTLDQPYTGALPHQLIVQNHPHTPGGGPKSAFAFAALALATVARRLRPRR